MLSSFGQLRKCTAIWLEISFIVVDALLNMVKLYHNEYQHSEKCFYTFHMLTCKGSIVYPLSLTECWILTEFLVALDFSLWACLWVCFWLCMWQLSESEAMDSQWFVFFESQWSAMISSQQPELETLLWDRVDQYILVRESNVGL